MGTQIPKRSQLISNFQTALKHKQTNTLREIARSEQIGDANMLCLAIKSRHMDMLKFLLDSCRNF